MDVHRELGTPLENIIYLQEIVNDNDRFGPLWHCQLSD